MTRIPLAAVLPFALTGCASGGDTYPSLQPRSVEKQGFAEPETPVAVATPDAALEARLAPLATRLDTIAKGFATAAATAERAAAAAKGRPAGSDAWLTAQTALAALDDWRAQTSALATDVEQIAIERGAALAPAYSALTTLRDRANGEGERQSETIARLQAMLAPA